MTARRPSPNPDGVVLLGDWRKEGTNIRSRVKCATLYNMGLSQWLYDNGQVAVINLSIAKWKLTRAARDQYRKGHKSGYVAGFSDSANGIASRETNTFPEPHPQVAVDGIEVDAGLRDLRVALWALGLETQFSCQGHPDRYVPNQADTWDNSAQILFTDAEQALKFVEKSIELLEDDTFQEGGFRTEVCHGIDSPVLRGDVRFSPTLLSRLSELWTEFEMTVPGASDKARS